MSSTAKVMPSEKELDEALRDIRHSEPSLGFKKAWTKVREQHPEWEIDNVTKERMRKLYHFGEDIIGAPSSRENADPSTGSRGYDDIIPISDEYLHIANTNDGSVDPGMKMCVDYLVGYAQWMNSGQRMDAMPESMRRWLPDRESFMRHGH